MPKQSVDLTEASPGSLTAAFCSDGRMKEDVSAVCALSWGLSLPVFGDETSVCVCVCINTDAR